MSQTHFLSVKRNIWIAVSLVTVIPLIILFYYFSGYYISMLTTGILAFLVFLGWWLIFRVFSSVSKLYAVTKKTLEDMGEESLPIDDEVKTLEVVLDKLSSKIKNNLEQLKMFSEKTDELNKEISSKVFVLSSILQVNDLFSKDIPEKDILLLLMQNLKKVAQMDFVFCSLREKVSGQLKTTVCLGRDTEAVDAAVQREEKHLSQMKRIIKVDRDNKLSVFPFDFKELETVNLALVPIYSRGRLAGIIGVGNNKEGFVFDKENIEILHIFSQNIAIVWEHKRLSGKVEELEMYDYLTGLYNRRFIVKRLEEEVKRATAYQRPCGFMLMEVVNYDAYQKEFGIIEAEKVIRKAADILKESLRAIDFIGRMGSNRLAAILIEKNRRQSRETAEELKKQVEEACDKKVKIVFSIAENPLDGTSAAELIVAAQEQIKSESKS